MSYNDDTAGPDAETLTNTLTRNNRPTSCTRVYCRTMAGVWWEITDLVVLMTNGWQRSKQSCQIETTIIKNRLAKEEYLLFLYGTSLLMTSMINGMAIIARQFGRSFRARSGVKVKNGRHYSKYAPSSSGRMKDNIFHFCFLLTNDITVNFNSS